MNALAVALSAMILSQAPATPRVLSVRPEVSTLRYRVVHKLHKVDGASKAVEAKVALAPDGTVQVMVRAAVKTFQSGDANRDVHMLEVLEADRFPHVVFKGTSRLAAPATYPAKVPLEVDGVLEFHGRKNPLKATLEVELKSPDEARATGGFAVSLEQFAVQRPSLLFVKIEDACRLEVDLSFKAEGK